MRAYTPAQKAAVNAAIDQGLGRTSRKARPPSAEALSDMVGDILSRWPDELDGGDRDAISRIIHVLDGIAEQHGVRRG